MDRQQKLEYQKKVEQYLTNENVYDLFEDLMKSLIVKQPDDPIAFLIEKLSVPFEGKKIFIVGPPGFKVRQFALQVADHYKFTTISVGDLLRKQVSKKLELGQEIQSYFKNYSLVSDQIVINIVKKQIEAIQKEKKNFILSGFPKTRVQGSAMQRAGIFPDVFIILNMDQAKIQFHCQEKFKSYEKTLDKAIINDKTKHVANHAIEYSLNIKQIKQIYANNYFEIDCTNAGREQILEDMARLLKFKVSNKRPKRPASIILVSSEERKQQRRSVGRKLSKRYGFVYISTKQLMNDQIARNTEVGRLALHHRRNGTEVDDTIINGLIQSRISQVDCQMQGFVVEGYPKSKGQAVALKDIYLKPSLVVMLGGSDPGSEASKELNDKYQNVILNTGAKLSDKQAFQNVCFQLQNS